MKNMFFILKWCSVCSKLRSGAGNLDIVLPVFCSSFIFRAFISGSLLELVGWWIHTPMHFVSRIWMAYGTNNYQQMPEIPFVSTKITTLHAKGIISVALLVETDKADDKKD